VLLAGEESLNGEPAAVQQDALLVVHQEHGERSLVVQVNDQRPRVRPGQGRGQVRSHGRLPHPALEIEDRHDHRPAFSGRDKRRSRSGRWAKPELAVESRDLGDLEFELLGLLPGLVPLGFHFREALVQVFGGSGWIE
jgi:hypothetical protein